MINRFCDGGGRTPTVIVPGVAHLSTTFAKAGTTTPADPDTVTALWWNPATRTTTTSVYGVGPEIVKEAVGVYRVDVPVTAPGHWSAQITGTGEVAASSLNRWEAAAGLA